MSGCDDEEEGGSEGDDEVMVDLEDAELLRDFLSQKLKHLSQFENRF